MNEPTPQFQRCAAQHFGPWMVYPQWFSQAIAAVKAGTFKPDQQDVLAASPDDPAIVGDWSGEVFKVRYYLEGGIARVPFFGQVTKGDSSFGGASSVWTRQSIRKALADGRVRAILLHVDSPGGTVAGTGDLADDVAAADRHKPVYTYFEDLGASAAYWIGSQGRRIFANPTAEVGSIGTMTYVEDTSGLYEKAGIKVTLIATGKYKGQWIDGNPVSEEYIEAVRTEVEDLNEHFLAGVLRGRKMSREHLMTVADGRVFIAQKAQQLGLIDEVSTLDAAMAAILKEISAMPITTEQFTAYAAENPQAAEVQAIRNEGYEKAKAELTPKAATVDELSAAFAGDEKFVLEQLRAGATLPAANAAAVARMREQSAAAAQEHARQLQAKDEAIAAKDQEIERLKFEQGGRGPINGGGGAGGSGQQGSGDRPDPKSDPKAAAAWEWDNDETVRNGFSTKDRYVAWRAAELKGQARIATRGSQQQPAGAAK